MNPRPKLTPTTAAPFLNPGITATQSALAICCGVIACPEESVSLLRTATAFWTLDGESSAAAGRMLAAIAKVRTRHAVRMPLCDLSRVVCMIEYRFIRQERRTRYFVWAMWLK